MGHVYNLKNSLKFKLLAFWREWTPFIDQKCTYEKGTKNLGSALPPPHLDKIQKNSSIFREIFPQMFYVQLFMSPSQSELVYTILLKLC